jgi:actin-related protein 5
VEGLLEEHDEAFYAVLAQEMAASRTVLDRLAEPSPSNDEAARYQLHLNAERWRSTEGLFQPRSLLGLDQCGLAEAVAQVLSQFPLAVQAALLSNVFVTGGASRIAGFPERLHCELLQLTPFGAKLDIAYARDPRLDAWKGAAMIGLGRHQAIPWITRDWYQENGEARLPHIANPAYYTNPY